MAQITIRLLGNFEVDLNGVPLSFAYENMRAVFAYLASNVGHPVTREKLASMIWPDQAQTVALDSLRQALWRLRKTLGETELSSPFFFVERTRVTLVARGDLEIDERIFREKLAQTARHLHRHPRTCAVCASSRQEAADLYRGNFLEDLLLPDNDLFDSWVGLQRQLLQDLALENLGWLADYHQYLGDEAASLDYTRRMQSLDPLSDDLALSLMRRLARFGKKDLALSFYHAFCRRLESELGQAPLPELARLAEEIRSADTPPFVSRRPVTSTLPVSPAPLVGRLVELRELACWLADPARRLVTLLGPGGCGKSRLALACSQQQERIFEDGVVYLNLSGNTRLEDVHLTIARAAGVQIEGEPANLGDFSQVLHTSLADRDQLWVLDNFEEAMAGKILVNLLLEAGPGLVVLVTSRERLGLPGEWVFPVGGLPFPPIGWNGDLSQYDAIVLFLSMVRQLNPAFALMEENRDAIVEICWLTEGFPLALCLAAAWARSLPCAEIVKELRSSLDLLGGSTPGGMHAVFERSWLRLQEEERRVFRQISVFQDGFDHTAAEEVVGAGLNTLMRLVDQSLLRASPNGRFEMHDLIRQFGMRKLTQAGESNALQRQHFEYFYRAASENDTRLRGGGSERFQAFFWLAREWANLRAAQAWGETGDPPSALAEARQLSAWMHEDFHGGGNQTRKIPLL